MTFVTVASGARRMYCTLNIAVHASEPKPVEHSSTWHSVLEPKALSAPSPYTTVGMAERIRLGNVYEHNEHGEVLTVHKTHDNEVWARPVKSRDNAGVISTQNKLIREHYRQFLGSVSMLDYPDNWERKAEAVKKRDGYRCAACSQSRDLDDGPEWQTEEADLHAHHIVPLGAGGSNARSNLITLCDECHGRVHGGVT